MSSGKYSELPTVEKLQALLSVAESQLKRRRLAAAALEREALNDTAFLQLSIAILKCKDCTGFSWYNFAEHLHSPVGWQMLQKIALRTKQPSLKSFRAIKLALQTFAHKHKIELLPITDMIGD